MCVGGRLVWRALGAGEAECVAVCAAADWVGGHGLSPHTRAGSIPAGERPGEPGALPPPVAVPGRGSLIVGTLSFGPAFGGASLVAGQGRA